MILFRGGLGRLADLLVCGLGFLAGGSAWSADAVPFDQMQAQQAEAAWQAAGCPTFGSPEAERLMQAAIAAGRADLMETLLARGSVMRKMLRIPPGGVVTTLRTVRTFGDIRADFDEEIFASFKGEKGWLVRRITTDRIEVWTSRRGRLFDGKGRLLNEARPPRRSGTGRQWYGAFLPDGRWVTTDLDDSDGTLAFFSAAGKPTRYQTMEHLAPGYSDYGWPLLGWGRSDQMGRRWVVNVGSEEGVATVWVPPVGPSRVLSGNERWQVCYPRALGPRGTGRGMSVPSDSSKNKLGRSEAGHGPSVGYPTYDWSDDVERSRCIVPNGNYVFGYWPKRESFFIGSDGNNANFLESFGEKNIRLTDYEPSGVRTRKFREMMDDQRVPEIDKTWCFDERGALTAWIRGRRLADAADGQGMLFRMTADSRIATLSPELKVRALRRFVWKDDSTADALALWDDLRMGLFIRAHRLYLACW